MEDARFDHFSRRLAALGSRRQALKALTASVAAVVAGARTADAQSCTATYRPCQGDGQCCAGAVCQSGLCQPGCRIDGVFRSASTPQPGTTCARCTPALSTTAWSPVNEGMSCWSGSVNLCGGPSTCQSGVCQASSAVTCQPLTACHVAGECNPNTGLCTNPPAEAGTLCGGGELCIGGFHTPGLRCDGSGACVGGPTVPCAPYACGESSCRTTCDTDGDCASGAVCREHECLYLKENGESCPADHHCRSGHCVEGICCDTACESLCDVCGTGTCLPRTCNDNQSCTIDSCDPTTGECVFTHDTTTDTCLIGDVCVAEGPNGGNVCQVCDPSADREDWTAVAAGVACGARFCIDADTAGTRQCNGEGQCVTVPEACPEICDDASGECALICGMVCPPGAIVYGDNCHASLENAIGDIQGFCVNGEPDFGRYIFYYPFCHRGGPLQISARGLSSGGGNQNDPSLTVHSGSFDPANPCTNLIAADSDSGCGLDAYVSFPNLAGGTYVVVVGSDNPVSQGGTHTVTFGDPPLCPV